MIRVYTDTSFLTEPFRKKVFPLLFDLWFLKNDDILKHYALVDAVLEADVVIFPVDYSAFYKHTTAFNALLSLAKSHQKPIWVYTSGDYGFTVHIPNCYNFRLGGFHSKMDDKTMILPSFVNDPYSTFLKQPFQVLPKSNKPDIGFVGHANGSLYSYFKHVFVHLRLKLEWFMKRDYFDDQEFYPSGIKRYNYLMDLKRSNQLKTNFILRTDYRAGVKNEEEKNKTTQEFYDNLSQNTYTFCCRGAGNFSVRFYETLAVGRIPILIDTDCRLPFHNSIDWNAHAVIIDLKNNVSLEQQILNFHHSKSPEALENIQKNNRLLWEKYLKLDGYFLNIHDTFISNGKL